MMRETTLDTLLQGPSLKNKALCDVEYILHAMVEAPYAGDEYQAITSGPLKVSFGFNSLDHVLATCPNGKIYHLSCALKNANFHYFKLTAEKNNALLEKFKTLKFAETSIEKADKLIGEIDPILQAEQAAITAYTGTAYETWNALLRGKSEAYFNSNQNNTDELKKSFVSALLAISGVNKNIDARLNTEIAEKKCYRNDEKLPVGMLAQMKQSNCLVPFSGLISFSGAKDTIFRFRPVKTTLVKSGHQKLINAVSDSPTENEILFPPMYLLCIDVKEEVHNTTVLAQQVWGAHTEKSDQYIVDVALTEAYENYLKKPYKNGNEVRYEINRPNHALAHHVRVVSYTDSVIDYFKTHAADEDFRNFCENLTHEEINIIKVLLAFSKTGRESEIAPLDNLVKYQQYQLASANYFKSFAEKHLSLSDHDIHYYHNILAFMGDPKFHEERATGSEQEKKTKTYINHIASLAHKLDLLRCHSKEKFEASVEMYVSDSAMIPSSDQQKAFDQLKQLAITTLHETGEGVGSYLNIMDSNKFQQCNRNPDYCMNICVMAKVAATDNSLLAFDMLLQELKWDVIVGIRIKNSIPRNKITAFIEFLNRFDRDTKIALFCLMSDALPYELAIKLNEVKINIAKDIAALNVPIKYITEFLKSTSETDFEKIFETLQSLINSKLFKSPEEAAIFLKDRGIKKSLEALKIVEKLSQESLTEHEAKQANDILEQWDVFSTKCLDSIAENNLLALVKAAPKKSVLDFIVKHKNCSDSVRKIILNNNYIDPSIFITIAQRAKSVALLANILKHPCCSYEIYADICNGKLTVEGVLSKNYNLICLIINNCITEEKAKSLTSEDLKILTTGEIFGLVNNSIISVNDVLALNKGRQNYLNFEYVYIELINKYETLEEVLSKPANFFHLIGKGVLTESRAKSLTVAEEAILVGQAYYLLISGLMTVDQVLALTDVERDYLSTGPGYLLVCNHVKTIEEALADFHKKSSGSAFFQPKKPVENPPPSSHQSHCVIS